MMTHKIGDRFRFFSVRVFGAWVEGRIAKICRGRIHIACYFHGIRWIEKRPLEMEVYPFPA